MNDVRELLRQAAPKSARDLDVERTAALARHRTFRRRRITMAAGVALVAMFCAATAVALITGGDEGRSVQVAGGTIAENVDAAVSLELPDGWQQLPLVERDDPKELLVVGTAPRPEGDFIAACYPDASVPTERSAYVTLYEYDRQGELKIVGEGGNYTPEAFQSRPSDFR